MNKKRAVIRKSTRQVKKNTKKTAKRPGKQRKSDAFKAFLLTAAIVIFSLLVSIAFITVHSSLKKPVSSIIVDDLPLPVVEEIIKPKVDDSKPVIIVTESTLKQKPVDTLSSVQTKRNVDTNAAVQPKKPENKTTAIQPQKPVMDSGNLVFIIDDAGNNLRELDPFLRIPYPITIAVLPGLPNSAEAARRIRAAGKEVFLHQPMEAINGQNPGPGAIYSGMTDNEIRAILKKNIAEIGPVAGMNNHQGSKITMDIRMMETVLSFCAEEKIIFVDSRTTADTEAPAASQKLGIKIQERDVFLDNEQDRVSMLRWITTGADKARKTGKAVMIGHTWSPELAPLLANEFPKLTEQGYLLSTPSNMK